MEPPYSPPLTSKEEEIQTDFTLFEEEKQQAIELETLLPQSEIGQLRILRETSTEEAKR
jgi:hypothetical protein